MASEILHEPGDDASEEVAWPPPTLPDDLDDRPPVWQTLLALAALIAAGAFALLAVVYALSVL